METDREEGERETVRLAEISNHASLYMGHRQWKIRWCCEMELLSFNPSNVPGDTHQITTEPSVHSHTDRGERTQPDPHCPHCCSPFSSPPSFTPLMLHARRRSKRGGQTMEMWMRAHSVSCPPLFSDEVAQFMFALYRRCLPHVISVTSNSLRSLCPFDTLSSTCMLRAHVQYRRGYLSVWECWTFLLKLHWIPALLTSVLWGGTGVAQLSVLLSFPITAAQMCVLPCVAVNYLIN